MILSGQRFTCLVASVCFLMLTGCSRDAKKARYLDRAQAQFKTGDYEQAEIEYLNVLRLDPTNRIAVRDLGIMAYEQGRIPRAFTLLKQAKEWDTNDLQVRLHLGLSEMALGGGNESRQEAEFVLDNDPTNGRAMLLLVDSCVSSNALTSAQQRLEQLEPVAGRLPDFHVALGNIALRSRDLNLAAASYRQALVLDPRSSAAHFALGNLYVLQNNPTNAEAEFKTAAELVPPRSAYRMRYADFQAASGDTNAALELLQSISSEAPDYLPALLRQAQFALGLREFENCEKSLKSVLQRDPTSLGALRLLAELHVAQGELNKAIVVLDQAIKQYPRVPELHYLKGLTCLANDDLPDAVTSLTQALTLQPDYANAALLLAQINIRKGHLNAAIDSLRELLRSQPNLYRARLLLASSYRIHGDLDQALGIYQDMAQTFTNNPEPVFFAGLVQRQQGQNDEARESFEKALALAPFSLPTLQQLVEMDLAEEHFDAAGVRVDELLHRQPDSPGLLVLLAQIHLAETNQPAAEAALLKAVALEPDFQAAQQMLASIYVASDRYEDALKNLQDVVARNTNDIGSWLQIAQLQSSASNYVGAKAAYEQVLACDPKSRPALNNLALLYAERLDDLDQAYELGKAARVAYPDDPYISDTLGWIYYRRGEYSLALPLLRQSAERLAQEPEVFFHLGMTQYMLGEEGLAKVALESALQLSPEASWRDEAKARLQVIASDPAVVDESWVKNLEKWRVQQPKEPPVLVRLAALREREGAWDQAAALYESALEVNPDLVSSLMGLARIDAFRLNKPQQALELARKARSLAPQDPVASHLLGTLVYQSTDYSWAYSLLRESAMKLPNDPGVLFDFAWASCSLGRWDEAVATMERVVQMKPSSPISDQSSAFLRMNVLMTNSTEAEANISEVQALLEADPEYVPGLMVLGLVQERKSEFTAARDTYERILKQFPAFSPAMKSLARLYFSPPGDLDKAYDYATRAREALPQDMEVSRLLGLIEYQRADYRRAAQLLAESAGSFQADAELHYRLGMAQNKLNGALAGKTALTKALQLAPESPLAAEAKQILDELR